MDPRVLSEHSFVTPDYGGGYGSTFVTRGVHIRSGDNGDRKGWTGSLLWCGGKGRDGQEGHSETRTQGTTGDGKRQYEGDDSCPRTFKWGGPFLSVGDS